MELARKALAVGGMVALLLGAMAAPASAKPLTHEHFHDDFTETFTFCGVTIRNTVVADGQELISARGKEGLVYFHNNVHLDQTFTNVATSKSLHHIANFVTKDLHVTDNGDGTLTVITLATGSFKVYGPDGEFLFSDPGQVRFRLLIDDGGTPTDPRDDEILSEELIFGSTGRNDLEGHDFCEDFLTYTS